MAKFFDLRRQYGGKPLTKKEVDINPFNQFEKWFKEVLQTDIIEPNAFSLATAVDEQPTLRTVLLKYFDEQGFVFFTNYNSKKAKQIAENKKVALLFPWISLERQVIITGVAEKISTAESVKYFLSRPRGSQIGAWVSNQSEVITGRKLLEQKFNEIKRKFQSNTVEKPAFWGGYRVKPTNFEFWQGHTNRLHDRFYYTCTNKGWKVERLAP